jgi:hypothetical protein
MMRFSFAAVKNWVSKTLDWVLHVQFGSDTESCSLSCDHVFEMFEVFFDCKITAFALYSSISFLFHLISRSVVCICVVISYQLSAVLLDILEIVRTICDSVWSDFECLKIC